MARLGRELMELDLTVDATSEADKMQSANSRIAGKWKSLNESKYFEEMFVDEDDVVITRHLQNCPKFGYKFGYGICVLYIALTAAITFLNTRRTSATSGGACVSPSSSTSFWWSFYSLGLCDCTGT